MITQMKSNMKTKFSILAMALLAALAIGVASDTAYAALCSRSDCPCVTVADPSNAVGPCSHYISNGVLHCRTKGHYY